MLFKYSNDDFSPTCSYESHKIIVHYIELWLLLKWHLSPHSYKHLKNLSFGLTLVVCFYHTWYSSNLPHMFFEWIHLLLLLFLFNLGCSSVNWCISKIRFRNQQIQEGSSYWPPPTWILYTSELDRNCELHI